MDIEIELNKYLKASKGGIKETWVKKNLPILYEFLLNKPGKSLAEKVYLYKNGGTTVCKVCGGEVDFLSINRGYRIYCSKKCSNNDADLTEKKIESYKSNFKEKWGVDNPMQVPELKDKLIETRSKLDLDAINETFKKTCLDKWGVDNPSKAKVVQEKKKLTTQTNWGVDNPFQSEEIKSKIKQTLMATLGVDSPIKSETIRINMKRTLLENLGVDNPMKSTEVKNKFKQTCTSKWGHDHFFKSEKMKSIIKQKTIDNHNISFEESNKSVRVLDMLSEGFKLICNSCDNEFTIHTNTFHIRKRSGENICLHCNPLRDNTSFMEKTIYNFVSENFNGEVLQGYKLNGKEIDIYLPELKMGFEFNGVYWHSSKFRDKNYHIDKIKYFKNLGITVFNIWEDDFTYKPDIIKSMILNRVGLTHKKIFARKCQIKIIDDNSLIRNFLDLNHIQGFCGSKVKIGLFYQGELVSLMTFGELRTSLGKKKTEGEWELIRFCNKLNTTVIGGASKLLNYFKQNFTYSQILSYSKNDYSTGDLYDSLGFKFAGETPPNYYWVVAGKRINRFNFRKDKLVKLGADKNMTESQIMESKGYYKIFDSGNKRWILRNEFIFNK